MNNLALLLQGAVTTVELTLSSMALGLVFGICLGILHCKKIAFCKPLLSSFVWAVRGTPLFVQVLVIYYGLPEILGISFPPFIAGMIALGINSTAYISEIVRGGIDSIPDGQWEASYVLGLDRKTTILKVILPQMLRITLPSLTNELTALIKETSILMVIGVAELTKMSKDIVVRELDPMKTYLIAAFFYLIMTSSLSFFAYKQQKKWSI
jgi:His/Glu/Gln/Arg/opine family amino acid ABC transporter permease subunit